MCESVKHSTDVPLIQDPDGVLVHKCKAPQGGTKTIGIPRYVLTVENPPDVSLLWRDDGDPPVLVQEDNGETITVDNI